MKPCLPLAPVHEDVWKAQDECTTEERMISEDLEVFIHFSVSCNTIQRNVHWARRTNHLQKWIEDENIQGALRIGVHCEKGSEDNIYCLTMQ